MKKTRTVLWLFWSVLIGGVILSSCSAAGAVPKNGESNDVYSLTVSHVNVDGRTIPCVVSHSSGSTALTCDWSSK